jgi:hypothetical protein
MPTVRHGLAAAVSFDNKIYVIGGDLQGNFALYSTQALASNVKGVTVLLLGHWLAEEQPTFVLK